MQVQFGMMRNVRGIERVDRERRQKKKREQESNQKTFPHYAHRCRVLILVLEHDNLKSVDVIQLLDSIVNL